MTRPKLFKHQEEGVIFLTGKNPVGYQRFILADDMGLGKTLQAIVSSRESGSERILIICPASLKINWKREIESIYPEDEINIIRDGPIKCKWNIINYDILEKHYEELLKIDFDSIILDEAHYIKGNTIRTKAVIGGRAKKKSGIVSFKGLCKAVDTIYALTGTPILNKPIEMFNLLKAIGHPLGANQMTFAKKYCDMIWMYNITDTRTGKKFTVSQDSYYKYYGNEHKFPINFRFPDYKGAKNLDQLRKELEGWIIRRKKDILDLPPKIREVREIELTPAQKKEYENAWDSYLDIVKNNDNIDNIVDARQLIEINKLKQVCSLSKTSIIAEDTLNMVDQEKKVIIFSQYTETIRTIKALIEKEGIKCVSLTGENTQEERQQAVDSFQGDDETKVFIANIKAGGVGLTLTESAIVIFADMVWSPGEHRQAEDRAHRIGQKDTVFIYYYICNDTIEKYIFDILSQKQDISDQVLDGKVVEVKDNSMEKEVMKKISELTNYVR